MPQTLSHSDAAARRAEIAKYAATHTAAETAIHFGVSESSVRRFAIRAGVRPVPGKKVAAPRLKTLQMVREFLETDRTFADLATEFGTSDVVVRRAYYRCRRAGLKVRAR